MLTEPSAYTLHPVWCKEPVACAPKSDVSTAPVEPFSRRITSLRRIFNFPHTRRPKGSRLRPAPLRTHTHTHTFSTHTIFRRQPSTLLSLLVPHTRFPTLRASSDTPSHSTTSPALTCGSVTTLRSSSTDALGNRRASSCPPRRRRNRAPSACQRTPPL